MIERIEALIMLAECHGDDIWSLDHCRLRGVPEAWVNELTDCFESNPQSRSQTIFVANRGTNQYEGIRDVDLACKLAEYLNVDTLRLSANATSRVSLVRLIKEAVEEG